MSIPAGKQSWAQLRLPQGAGVARKPKNNPMQRMQTRPMENSNSKLPMHLSRRCLAKTRSGTPCESPAMPNGRCRMHGGMSPGAPKGNRNAWKHGRYSAQAIARRREVADLLRAARELLNEDM